MTVKKITKKYTVTSKSLGGNDLGANIASGTTGYDVGASKPIKKEKKEKKEKVSVATTLTKAQKKAGLTYNSFDPNLTKGQKNKISQAKYLKSIKKGKKKKRSARRKLRKESLGI